jgi:beta-glucosidase
LRAFRKIDLRPGDQTRVKFELDRNALSYYDEREQTWRVDPGQFRNAVGASSRDIRLVETVEVTEETTYGGSTSVAAGRIVQ